jgi:hypothetical protein
MLYRASNKWLAAALGAIMALAAPAAAFADCGTSGGGGNWGIDIKPDSWTFSSIGVDKDFTVKNTGTQSWKPRAGGWEVSAGFLGNDLNGCLNTAKTYWPGDSCIIKVRATQSGKTGKIQIQNDQFVTDYSPLWSN